MIVPEEDEDMQYFDDDLRSMSSIDTVREKELAELSELEEEDEEDEEGIEGIEEVEVEEVEVRESDEITPRLDSFCGFNGFGGEMKTNVNAEKEVSEVRHGGWGDDVNGNMMENKEEEEKEEKTVERKPEVDAFGRCTVKGRGNWFSSEYGSIFHLMAGDLLPREFTKPARKATTDVKYIKQLYTAPDMCLSELSVGEDTKRIGWGTFFKGDPTAWNIWNREDELATLTTLDVQRNVAAAVNSRRKMKWAIGVEKNGMVTGVSLTEDEKDILRQAIDFSLSREFVPELDPRIVNLEFIRVSCVTGNRLLIIISINSLVESLHQLSSGRIFYLVGDKVVMAENINQIRLALEERMKHENRCKEKGLRVEEGWNTVIGIKKTTVVGIIALSIGVAYAVKRCFK
ncbi:hypothetical protein PFISCL1PPCAC_23886 [Pristionchus fissidentatus]|uniref:Uncharacterized protein n=1 Tax=Pristionchus fissidentatus TaxID=1538716 RepID=A0AAV5WSC0_9BILA|nr:hypothetical protein PFISCL1PPCAC_23886 [Pristionchus fissidentatus]